MESNFYFPVFSSFNLEEALLQVHNKRIDAYVSSQDADRDLKKLKLNTIHREYYRDFKDMLIITKGPKGDELNKILSNCLRKLKASGRLQELNKKMHSPYTKWQPADMGW